MVTGAREYDRFYRNMRGVDFSGDGSAVSAARFAYAENMYRDYEGDGEDVIESVPGFRKIASLGGCIHGIFSFLGADGAEYLAVHAGDKVYRFPVDGRDEIPDSPAPVASAADRDSRAFRFADALYLLDGEQILCLRENSARAVSDTGEPPYIPTLFRGGEEYEQRNLLTRKFYERYDLSDAEEYARASEGLLFRITDPDAAECTLYGCDRTVAGELCIPSRVEIGGKRYLVASIADRAFEGQTAITSVLAANGIRRVGKLAFSGCTAMTSAILPDSVILIDNGAFDECRALVSVRAGRGLTAFGNAVFSMSGLQRFDFGGSEEEFSAVENRSTLGTAAIRYYVTADRISVELPVNAPADTVYSVTVEGDAASFSVRTENGRVRGVILTYAERAELDGRTIRILGRLQNGVNTSGAAGGFLSAHPDLLSDPAGAICGCRVAEAYDGRIFLAGNPDFPNVVFYSGRGENGRAEPLYFGELNYFADGVGGFPVCSLLAAGGSLAVFKQGDDGTGSIFYHTPAETGFDLLPKIYPVSYVHSGILCEGESISFFDDPVFVSKNGLSALEKTAINLERSVATRSHNVNKRLLSEDLSEASLAVFGGYLALLTNGNLYLADSRASFTGERGAAEYEWFFLTGIGCCSSDRQVFRYSTEPREGYGLSDKPDERVTATVYSTVENGETVYYTKEAEPYPLVYRTEEYEGGDFHPARKLCAVSDLLFFGTENGELCLFNTDKRGVPPPHLLSDPDFSEEDYRRAMGRRIHPYYYDFDRHAPRWLLQTKMDDCGVPHLRKSTVKRSLVLKLRSFPASRLSCEVITDRGGYREIADLPGGASDFSELDFSALPLAADETFHFALAEREKNWVEKQICVSSESFRAPIGIAAICYRFTVAGRIKNQ